MSWRVVDVFGNERRRECGIQANDNERIGHPQDKRTAAEVRQLSFTFVAARTPGAVANVRPFLLHACDFNAYNVATLISLKRACFPS